MSALKHALKGRGSNFLKNPKLQLNKIACRFASSEHNKPKPDEFNFQSTEFTSVWWKRSAFALVAFYVWGKLDDYFYADKVHPITRWIAHNMESEEQSKQKQIKLIRNAQEKARKRLLDLEIERYTFRRIRSPDLFTRASPNNIAPGTQVDLSDLEIKFV